MTLEELFKDRPVNVREILARLGKVADELGLPFGERSMTFNSRRAQELGKWAEANGKAELYQNAVFKAYFVDGSNIAKIDILTDLAGSIGLSPEEARNVLEHRSYKDAVDKDWALSRSMGITAVPTFTINMRSLVGAQPYEKLAGLLMETGVPQK